MSGKPDEVWFHALEQAWQVTVLVGAVNAKAGAGLGGQGAVRIAHEVKFDGGIHARGFDGRGFQDVTALYFVDCTDDQHAQVCVFGDGLRLGAGGVRTTIDVCVRGKVDMCGRKVAQESAGAVSAGRENVGCAIQKKGVPQAPVKDVFARG